MGLLDELEQLDKSKDKNEITGLLKEMIKNQKKILKMLNKLSSEKTVKKTKGPGKK